MSRGFAEVLESPAVPLLMQLEGGGIHIAAIGDRLKVSPIRRLTGDQRAALDRHRDEVLTLLRICDETVQARREVFAGQLAASGASFPRFIVRARDIYTVGTCFSCGEPASGHGCRCWRCALALRLALRAPIPSTFFVPHDEARVA